MSKFLLSKYIVRDTVFAKVEKIEPKQLLLSLFLFSLML